MLMETSYFVNYVYEPAKKRPSVFLNIINLRYTMNITDKESGQNIQFLR